MISVGTFFVTKFNNLRVDSAFPRTSWPSHMITHAESAFLFFRAQQHVWKIVSLTKKPRIMIFFYEINIEIYAAKYYLIDMIDLPPVYVPT